MEKRKSRGLLSILIALALHSFGFCSNVSDSTSISVFIESSLLEMKAIGQEQDVLLTDLSERLSSVDRALALSATPISTDAKLDLLLEKIRLKEEYDKLENDKRVQLARARYKKGIELIRLLYEKILGLDHHFFSLQANQQMVNLSNPHHYPEFKNVQKTINEQTKRNTGISLPISIENNVFITGAFAIYNTLFGEGDKRKKEQDLEGIACILDFTMRMSNDLDLIYYETEYLKTSNQALKEDCAELFEEYAKVVGYHVPLEKCRDSDDWETLYNKLDDYTADISTLYAGSEEDKRRAFKKHSSLEFPVNLMIEFINKYNNFISQGKKYYHKFEVILGNYQNEKVCSKELPAKFQSLKTDIKMSINKFDEAYNIAELRGSKLKDLLYGASE